MAELSPVMFSFPVSTDFHQPIICTGIDAARVNLDSATSLVLTVWPRPREGAIASFTGTTVNCITEIDYTTGEILLNFEPGDLAVGEYLGALTCILSDADVVHLGWVEIKVTRGIT